MAINQAQAQPYNQNFNQEIEQAIAQKQLLINSLNNSDVSQAQRDDFIKQIRSIDDLLGKALQNSGQNSGQNFEQNPTQNLQNQNLATSKVSLNELNLQAKVSNLEKSLEAQNAKNQELQSVIIRLQQNQNQPFTQSSAQSPTNIPLNINNISNDLNNKLIQNTSKNISIASGLSTDIIKEYFYLGWDYLARDRLPKILSTRLWLVVGGSYFTQALGQDNTLKIVSIVLMVVFYILSEIVLKMSDNAQNNSQNSAQNGLQNRSQNNIQKLNMQNPKFY
jgi:hypothetical protein